MAGPCADLLPLFSLEKLRNVLGNLPGAGSSAAGTTVGGQVAPGTACSPCRGSRFGLQ